MQVSSPVLRHPRRLAGVAVALLGGLASIAATQPASTGHGSPAVRLNQVQAIATHNSYHRELTSAEKAVQATRDRNWWNLEYSHASLPVQFEAQRVRSIELDVFPDPQGGLYRNPIVRKEAGLGPNPDADLAKPGFKVMHWADHDYGTSCSTLVKCLRQAKTWSDANPKHVPIPVLLELKSTDPAYEQLGGPRSPRWDVDLMDRLDAEIRSVLGDKNIIKPDDIRRPGRTLEESVLKYGWPSLEKSRGKFMFLMDNNATEIQSPYLNGHPNLEGRVLFTNAVPGRPDAAFVERNVPTGEDNLDAIRDLVRRGYFVRTRADEPFNEARSGDTSRLQAALASGAQVVSTDFPVPGLAARYGSDYVAQLPGRTVARCNPVNAPRSCRTPRLEPATR
ncbi:phosphatidylinositol-specific phospholipase C1-like protein [Actinomadura barringtoniae]|uniref:phosphatidylinositol-specific phospholipase C1-like protein n=1 Tax=Actinomadura barringtoniae TaxID=1427535 RepID=UPI0027DE664C|nr:phosphatidylinositol-specific phospholipase C1-like protein [Actinomadura barringtoniae]